MSAHTGGCGLIGVLPVGCELVSVPEESSREEQGLVPQTALPHPRGPGAGGGEGDSKDNSRGVSSPSLDEFRKGRAR
jgi:hypothetical protein